MRTFTLSRLAVGASAIQIFTKTPNQWREPTIAALEAGQVEILTSQIPLG